MFSSLVSAEGVLALWVKNFLSSASFCSCFSWLCLKRSISIKNSRAASPNTIAQIYPQIAPAVTANPRQSADKMVKKTLNFKYILFSRPPILIYIILYTRAREKSRKYKGAVFIFCKKEIEKN